MRSALRLRWAARLARANGGDSRRQIKHVLAHQWTLTPSGLPLVDAYVTALALWKTEDEIAAAERGQLVPFCRWILANGSPETAEAAVLGLTRADVLIYIEHQLAPCRGRRRSIATVYGRLAALRRFYAWLCLSGRARRNPVPAERRPRLRLVPGSAE